MSERKYLPTIGDLIDRLSISLMKSIFIDRETYRAEMALLQDDILSCFQEAASKGTYLAPERLIHAILVLMLANRYIWENEADIRGGTIDKEAQNFHYLLSKALQATHSINGVRSRAKNEINKIFGERVDGKIDCLAADLPPEFGNWRVFDE